jgi:hypothetical protein
MTRQACPASPACLAAIDSAFNFLAAVEILAIFAALAVFAGLIAALPPHA